MHVLQASLLVALGGAAGALTRFAGVSGVNRLAELMGSEPGDRFPFGTLTVNALGCLAIGVIMGLSQSADGTRSLADSTRLLIVIGFLGSLTTFSTFGAETIRLVEENRTTLAITNVGANLALSLVGVAVGILIGRLFVASN